jgi:hypothetical protein
MLKRNLFAATLGATAMLTVTAISATEANAAVLELGLGIDASGSINPLEFDQQIDAYESIFSNNFATNFLSSNPQFDTIVVSATLFATDVGTTVGTNTTGWFTITDDASANLFATAVGNLTRTGIGGFTAIGDAITTITDDIFNNGIDSDRQVIDISTDGQNTAGGDPVLAATNAVLAGVDSVNMLGVGNGIDQTEINDIANAGNGFVQLAPDFDSYESTLRTKIGRETGNVDVPEPASILGLLAVGAIAAGTTLKKRQAV